MGFRLLYLPEYALRSYQALLLRRSRRDEGGMLPLQQGSLFVPFPGNPGGRRQRTEALNENATLVHQVDEGIDGSVLQRRVQPLTEGINPVE
ncbi:MAG: hypothetical protein ACE10B_01610 [Phycisphaerales bacterium]